MLGLMVAAMFSATASMVSSQLNVFAGVLTHDFYHKIIKPDASEDSLVRTGRILTIVLGAFIIFVAIMVPHMGGAEDVIISITSLIVTPLLLPSVWGMYSKRITQNDIWPTALISFGLGAIVKFGLITGGWFESIESLTKMSEWISDNLRSLEIVVGVILPAVIMTLLQLRRREVSEGWKILDTQAALEEKHVKLQASSLPAKIVAWAIGFCALLIFVLWIVDRDIVLLAFSIFLAVVTILAVWTAYRIKST
jgi:Na+/proline symporter